MRERGVGADGEREVGSHPRDDRGPARPFPTLPWRGGWSRRRLRGCVVPAGFDLAGFDLADVDLTGSDLPGVDLAGVDLAGVDLAGFDLADEVAGDLGGQVESADGRAGAGDEDRQGVGAVVEVAPQLGDAAATGGFEQQQASAARPAVIAGRPVVQQALVQQDAHPQVGAQQQRQVGRRRDVRGDRVAGEPGPQDRAAHPAQAAAG
ncbi:pentapeptide repeat-containing protein, partial [Piscicoccus intestinalis]|uniref:pentapeptide repeat-containing protein n=1 Tax=Piscicoccus intestinalis TaxID=746033 RepID=UPI0014703F91